MYNILKFFKVLKVLRKATNKTQAPLKSDSTGGKVNNRVQRYEKKMKYASIK